MDTPYVSTRAVGKAGKTCRYPGALAAPSFSSVQIGRYIAFKAIDRDHGLKTKKGLYSRYVTILMPQAAFDFRYPAGTTVITATLYAQRPRQKKEYKLPFGRFQSL